MRNVLDNNNRLNTEVVVPLKYLSNFWRSIDLCLVNYKIELDLSSSGNCITSEKSRADVKATSPATNINNQSNRATRANVMSQYSISLQTITSNL